MKQLTSFQRLARFNCLTMLIVGLVQFGCAVWLWVLNSHVAACIFAVAGAVYIFPAIGWWWMWRGDS